MMENSSQKMPPGAAAPTPLASHGAAPMTGRFALPGDAAIGRAALLLGALALGRSRIEGLAMAGSLPALVEALRRLGARLAPDGDIWQVDGLGVGGLLAPEGALDLSGAADLAPLLAGLLAPYGFPVRLSGVAPDALDGLDKMLAPLGVALAEEDGIMVLRGSAMLPPLRASDPDGAGKAALLLAGAQIAGISTIVETRPTPGHMEKLLATFGGAVSVQGEEAEETATSITGLVPLRPGHVAVPGDPALAAYPLLAGLIVPGSDLLVESVLINPMRTGLIDTLLEMGGDIQFLNQRETGGEHVADLRVRSSRLKGVRIGADHAVAMRESLPALAVAAAYAQGETVIEGFAAGEALCDAIATGLGANKVDARVENGRLTIAGRGAVEGGGTADGDAHLAMSLLMLGLASKRPVTIGNGHDVEAVFPGFVSAMNAAGARINPAKGAQP